MTNWENIRSEWETTKITLKALAKNHGVKLGTLKSRKSREGWTRNPIKKHAINQEDKVATHKKRKKQKNRSGNPNPTKQFTKRNSATITHGFFSKYILENIFGGKDESSQDLIQGITLAGMFFYEVALMPELFVSQAEAHCSIDGSKYRYNCNPASPYHWFKENYIDNLEEKNLIRLHFTMDDNPSLSARVISRYKRMFTGVFYKRFILY